MADNRLHTPVMLERTLELLTPALERPGAVLVDATLGLGGHAEAFLERFAELTFVGLDRDPHALELAGERLARFGSRVHLVHSVYDRVRDVLDELGIPSIAGVLFDLGVSSMQLDQVERGFSYSKDAPLDMRMDDTAPLTAARILAEYDEASLRRIFYEYGEEKLAPRYASRIVREREIEPLVSSAQLVELLIAATPAALQRAGHPAKRVFQALRIVVNDELTQIDEALPLAWDVLKQNGRFAGISFHSLEDRRVKRFLAARAQGCVCPPDLPICVCGHEPEAELLSRRAIAPTPGEVAHNPRSASARMRVARKL